jgi:hypothetical protein
VLLVLAVVIGITYQDLTQLYYVNDEWIQFGLVKVHGIFVGISQWSIQEILIGKGRPLGTFVNNLIFFYFPYNVFPFAVISWLLHFGNSFFVYLIAKKVSKNRFISIIASLFFSVSQISYQSFSWVAASVQVGASALFMFNAIYLYLIYLDNKQVRLALIAWLSVYVSILFKDSSFAVIVFLPLLSLLYAKKSLSLFNWIRTYWLVVICVISFSVYRLLSLLELSSKGVGSLFASRLLSRYALYIWNIIFYPVISFSHFFVPYRYMYRLADIFSGFLYPYMSSPQFSVQRDTLIHTIVPDMISVLLFIPIVACFVYAYIQDKTIRKTYLFALVYYIVVFIPFAIYLDHRNVAYVESRYMYVQSLGIGLFIGGLCEVIKNNISAISKRKYLGWVCVLPVLSLFLMKQSSLVRREIAASAYEDTQIKYITTEVKKVFPILPLNPIIYLDGNRSYFYYPNMKVPLQVGPGYVFFILYYDQIGSPELFDKNQMLWQLFVEWYEEANGKGYGYFYDKEKLKLFMQQNKNVSIEQLVGIYYNSDTKKFEDKTVSLKEYILK